MLITQFINKEACTCRAAPVPEEHFRRQIAPLIASLDSSDFGDEEHQRNLCKLLHKVGAYGNMKDVGKVLIDVVKKVASSMIIKRYFLFAIKDGGWLMVMYLEEIDSLRELASVNYFICKSTETIELLRRMDVELNVIDDHGAVLREIGNMNHDVLEYMLKNRLITTRALGEVRSRVKEYIRYDNNKLEKTSALLNKYYIDDV